MYAVIRVEKYKRAAVGGICKERNREKDDGRNYARSDIDKTATDQNVTLVDCKHFDAEISKRLKAAGVKERDDSIVLLGGLYTATSDYFTKNDKYVELTEEQKDAVELGRMEDPRTPEQRCRFLYDEKAQAFFRDCLQFHIYKYCEGDASRLIHAKIDFDEKTPHLQVYSVPLQERTNKKGVKKMHLCAKELVGNRLDLRKMQDEFHEKIAAPRGLERGEKVDWDKPLEERKRHEKTYEHKKAQQKAEQAAQQAVIDKNDKIIKEQEKATQQATERLEKTKKEELKARTKLEQEAKAAELMAKSKIKRRWFLFRKKDGRPYFMDIKDYQNATNQAAAVKCLLDSPVYTPPERQEMQREADAARRAKKEYEQKAANIDQIVEQRVNDRIALLNRTEPQRIAQLERELSRRNTDLEYLVDAIKMFLQLHDFSIKRFEKDYGVKITDETEDRSQSHHRHR